MTPAPSHSVLIAVPIGVSPHRPGIRSARVVPDRRDRRPHTSQVPAWKGRSWPGTLRVGWRLRCCWLRPCGYVGWLRTGHRGHRCIPPRQRRYRRGRASSADRRSGKSARSSMGCRRPTGSSPMTDRREGSPGSEPRGRTRHPGRRGPAPPAARVKDWAPGASAAGGWPMSAAPRAITSPKRRDRPGSSRALAITHYARKT